MSPGLPRLHAVSDERTARRPDLLQVGTALAAGAPGIALHARGRALSGREHHELARRLAAVRAARLIVNDRLDIALAIGAVGVQLGARDIAVADARRLHPAWLIGRSVHSAAEAAAAQDSGADYLVLGPVFATASHPGAPPLGLAVVRAVARLTIPIIAIGGITPERVGAVRAAGAWGVAAIRALWDAPDPAMTAAAMREGLE